MTAKKKYKDFESALTRLEEITERLESGEAPLEESLALYSEGVEIAGFCTGKLAEAEKKITILKEQGTKLVEVPLVDEEEEKEDEA
ncbi:MAG: exodeoxyribonuclease VII small subunit [candidate division Zixibacteria bacterium]|nr:exodeoxyribonuclease VII small subunit [candidate division Zixibacteria bacterium]